MEQPNTCCIHIMGGNGISGKKEKILADFNSSGTIYDNRQRILPSDSAIAGRFRAEPHISLLLRHRNSGNFTVTISHLPKKTTFKRL